MREDMRKWLPSAPPALIAAFIWTPLWMLISGSFMGEAESSENLASIPKGRGGAAVRSVIARYPALAAYVELLSNTSQFFTVFWSSYRQVFPVVLGHILLGVPTVWMLTKFHFRGKKILYILYIVLMLVPFQVIMASGYLILNGMGLINTTWTIILFGAASTLPVFIMTRSFVDIPTAIMEVVVVDGASSFQIFLRFGLPLGALGILSAVVLGFLKYWNAIEAPQAFLKNQVLWPLSLYIPNITVNNAGVSLIVLLITLMPPLLILLSGQKYLEQDIISSGMKDQHRGLIYGKQEFCRRSANK